MENVKRTLEELLIAGGDAVYIRFINDLVEGRLNNENLEYNYVIAIEYDSIRKQEINETTWSYKTIPARFSSHKYIVHNVTEKDCADIYKSSKLSAIMLLLYVTNHLILVDAYKPREFVSNWVHFSPEDYDNIMRTHLDIINKFKKYLVILGEHLSRDKYKTEYEYLKAIANTISSDGEQYLNKTSMYSSVTRPLRFMDTKEPFHVWTYVSNVSNKALKQCVENVNRFEANGEKIEISYVSMAEMVIDMSSHLRSNAYYCEDSAYYEY
jgi:hypothetical protein